MKISLYVIVWLILHTAVMAQPEELSDEEVRAYVELLYDRYYIDTTGEEPTISVTLVTDSTFNGLDSLGIVMDQKLRAGRGWYSATIPVRLKPRVAALEGVVHLVPGGRLYRHPVHQFSAALYRDWDANGELVVQAPATFGTALMITLEPCLKEVTDSIYSVTASAYRRKVEPDSLGFFTLVNIVPGYYHCTLAIPDRLDPEQDSCMLSSEAGSQVRVVIEDVRIKANHMSVISRGQLDRLPLDWKGSRADTPPIRCVWEESYELLKAPE